MGGELGGLGTTALEGDTGTVSRGERPASMKQRDAQQPAVCRPVSRMSWVTLNLTEDNYSIDFLSLNFLTQEWKHSTEYVHVSVSPYFNRTTFQCHLVCSICNLFINRAVNEITARVGIVGRGLLWLTQNGSSILFCLPMTLLHGIITLRECVSEIRNK